MHNRVKYFTLVALVFSLTGSIASANPVVVKQMAQAATTESKPEADKLFEEGLQQYRVGKYPQALQAYQKVLSIRQQQNDKVGIAKTLNNIGEVYLGLELDEKALEVLQPALAIWQELKDKKNEEKP